MISFGHTINFSGLSFRMAESIVKTPGLLACIISSTHKTECFIFFHATHRSAFSSGNTLNDVLLPFVKSPNSWFLLFFPPTSLWGFFSFFFKLLSCVSKCCRHWWMSSGFFSYFHLAIIAFWTQIYLFRAWIFSSHYSCCSDVAVLLLQ